MGVLSKLRPWWNPFSAKIFGPLGKIITPTQLSFMNLLLGAVAGYLIYLNNFNWAAFCIITSAILDGMDGAISRYKGTGSRFGGVIDSTIDRLNEGFIFWGLVYQDMLAIPALIINSVVSYAGAKGGVPGKGLIERGERMILLTLILLFNQIHWGLIVLIVFSIPSLFMRIYSIRKVLKAQTGQKN